MNSTVILLVSWRNALFLPLKHYLIQCQWRAHLNVEQMMNILFEIEAVFVDPLKSSNSCSSFTQSLFEKGKTCLLILGATNRKNLFTGQDFFLLLFVFPALHPRQRFNMESNGRLLTWGIIPLLHSPGILLGFSGSLHSCYFQVYFYVLRATSLISLNGTYLQKNQTKAIAKLHDLKRLWVFPGLLYMDVIWKGLLTDPPQIQACTQYFFVIRSLLPLRLGNMLAE